MNTKEAAKQASDDWELTAFQALNILRDNKIASQQQAYAEYYKILWKKRIPLNATSASVEDK